ncbi:MAG: DUF5312 family protein [Treponemataceae bacterium]|nr:DUF5312 family protein [Treponemataceae bacterium]
MGFFKKLIEAFQSVFLSSNPEIKGKIELKKMENELKEVKPSIYKNSFATANVGQAFYVLYTESLKISNVLQRTICSDDAAIANHFSNMLIRTGFHDESLTKLNSLSYNSILDIFSNAKNKGRAREIVQKNLDEVGRVLGSPELRKIEKTMSQLDRLNEICNFKYIDLLRMFSPDFNPNMKDQDPVFMDVEIGKLDNYFLDLLFLISNFEITAAQGRAICALASQLGGIFEDERQQEKLLSSLRKMAAVFNHILNVENLQLYVKVIKQNTDITFREASFSSNKLSGFATRLQRQVASTIDRVETELQDARIESDTNRLFDTKKVLEIEHYNAETSNFFINLGFPAFLWLTPLKIVKSFIHYYYSEGVQALLNDIVVEGFFNNPGYKSEFAQKVFACTEGITKFSEFEALFEKGNEFDLAVLKSYARECSHNPELGKKLASAIDQANLTANNLLKSECTAFSELYTVLSSVLQEAHKVNATDITNIKLLFNSSRNRDNVELLESQFDKWGFFIDIMKNYVIINTVTEN